MKPVKPAIKRRLWAILFMCALLCPAQNGFCQSFKRQFPKVLTPVITTPGQGDFKTGLKFNYVPARFAQNSTKLEAWERVKLAEAQYPTFNGATANIPNAATAAQWAKLYRLARNANLKTKLKYVDDFFNQWPYIHDAKLWKTADLWAAPREFMMYGGDCEDFAIAKFYALKALGVPAKTMCIAVVNDFKAMITHVVLVVENPARNEFYVLDNAAKAIYKNGSLDVYEPVCFVNEDNVWRPGP